MSRRALGRGLRALIPESEQDSVTTRAVPIDQIEPNPKQPRKHFDEESLQQLRDSIATHGILEPVIVRPWQGRYELVVGERRWRAAQLAGLDTVPAIVRTLTDLEALELALIENVQREDLNPIEEAETYRRLIDEFGMTQKEVAERVGKPRSTVANSLRLLDMEPELREKVAAGDLSAGHAKAILSVPDREDRLRLARKVKTEGLSVRAVEKLASEITSTGGSSRSRSLKKPVRAEKTLDPMKQYIVDRLQETLGTRVRLVGGDDRGRIEIDFYSQEDMERIIELLGVALE